MLAIRSSLAGSVIVSCASGGIVGRSPGSTGTAWTTSTGCPGSVLIRPR